MESRESRADSWKGPLLTLSCRHRPGWTGGSDRTKRGRTLEKRSGQRGSQSGQRGSQRDAAHRHPPGSIALSRTPTRALVEYLQQRWKPGVFTDPEELKLWERALSLRIPAAQAQRRRPSPSPPRAGAVAGGVKSGALWRPSPFYKSFRPGPLLGSEIGS